MKIVAYCLTNLFKFAKVKKLNKNLFKINNVDKIKKREIIRISFECEEIAVFLFC